MKYTKKQRHEIYKIGLEKFDLYNTSGLCHVLIRSTKLRHLRSFDLEPYFPEFYLFKPYDEAYNWWDSSSESNEQRKLVLMFCIEMTR